MRPQHGEASDPVGSTLVTRMDAPSLISLLAHLQTDTFREHPDEALQFIVEHMAGHEPFCGALLLLDPASSLCVHLSQAVFTGGDLRLRSNARQSYAFLQQCLPASATTHSLSPLPPAFHDHIATTASHALLTVIGTPERAEGLLLLSSPSPLTEPTSHSIVTLYSLIIAHVFSDVQVTEELRTLLTAARDMAEKDDLQELLQRLLVYATELTHTEAASILLQDPRTGKLTFRAAVGPHTEPLWHLDVPLDSIAGRAFQERRAIIVADASTSPLHFRHVDENTGFHTHSLMAIPIFWRRDIIGVIEVLNKRSGTFVEQDLNTLKALAGQAAALIAHAHLAAEREVALQQLRQLDERKTKFMHLTSHELRTPLTIIRGYAEMLLEELNDVAFQGADPEQVTTWHMLVTEILNGTKRMASIVEEISHAVNTPKGLAPTERARVDLRTIIEFVLAELDTWTQSKNVIMETDLPAVPVIVEGHWQHLKEAVLQIANNAVKFSPDFGRVEIVLWQDDRYAYISIKDTGPGIPQEEQERIFDSFYQVENALNRQHPGLGLGLTIARQAVEKHQGQIWVDSQVGQGSTFTIVLPLRISSLDPVDDHV